MPITMDPQCILDKQFPRALEPHLISLCPTMDLVAVVTATNTLEVFRFNGQRAFGSIGSYPDPAKIVRIAWTPDGESIYLAWSTGQLEQVVSQSGKVEYKTVVRQGSTTTTTGSSESQSQITHLSCAKVLLDPGYIRDGGVLAKQVRSKAVENPVSKDARETLLDQWFKLRDEDFPFNLEAVMANDRDAKALKQDLPRLLSLADPETQLPKLSVLPPAEDRNLGSLVQLDQFTSNVEGINRREEEGAEYGTNRMPLTFTAHDDGLVEATAFTNLYGGGYEVPKFDSQLPEIVNIASHPFAPLHAVLSQGKSYSTLALNVLDFTAFHTSSQYVGLFKNKFLAFGEIQAYILHSIVALRTAWSSAKNLPSRFLANATEALEENDDLDLTSAFYHLIATGDCAEPLKEWLTRDIGERNHKRWDQAVTTGYADILTQTHENLLPALERCAVIISGLRVLCHTPQLSIFGCPHDSQDTIIKSLDKALDQVTILIKLGHHILRHAKREQLQYQVFSHWLHAQIQLQGAGPSSQTAQDAAEKAADVDHGQLLEYILGPLSNSRLDVFLGKSSTGIEEGPKLSTTVDEVTAILNKHAENCLSLEDEPAVWIDLLRSALNITASWKAVEEDYHVDIAKSHTVSGTYLIQERDVSECHDIRLVVENDETIAIYVIHVSERRKHQIHLTRFQLSSTQNSTTQGPSHSLTSQQYASLSLKPTHEIKHLKFLDDDRFLVLSQSKDGSHVFQLPYSLRLSQSDSPLKPEFKPFQDLIVPWSSIPAIAITPSSGSKSLKQPQQTIEVHDSLFSSSVSQTFTAAKDKFEPRYLDVVSREDKELVLVLDEARRRIKVFVTTHENPEQQK